MSVHTSEVLIFKSIPGISSSSPSLWLFLDSQSATNNCGPGLYMILMLCWLMCSSIFVAYVTGCSILLEDYHQWCLVCSYASLTVKAVMVEFLQLMQYSLSILLELVSALVKLLLANAIGCNNMLSGVSSLGNCIPFLICRTPAPYPTPDVSVYR